MKRLLLIISILSALCLPALSFADAGHAEGTPHDAVESTGSMHIHEDGSIHAHSGQEGFALATPLSGRWWTLVGISLVLMGMLSIGVQKYLQIQ